MNKSKLKTYAPQARKDFIAAVTARANLLGLSEAGGKLEVAPGERKGDIAIIAGREWPAKVHEQRERLIKHIQTAGFAQTMEAVAYTWFNRFAALRYMEIHDYLDYGYRVLSNRAGGMPEILNHATELELPGFNKAKAIELKLAGNKDGELYKMLLVAQCNALSRAMPFLFERIDDETELLLPDNLLRTDSIIAKLVVAIPEEDWQEVEIIGWLYQFYISEKKDEVIGKVVKSEDIPAATQLFTPNWIVKYLVQNSLGAQWLATYPKSKLNEQMDYYIEPAAQTNEVNVKLAATTPNTLNPEELTLIDPASGSGHILVEAYEILKAIYLERGYRSRDIPQLILEKNLFGLDIDERAAQLTGFALMMKGRADDRLLFERGVRLNVMALVDSMGFDAEGLVQNVKLAGYKLQPSDVTELKRLFEYATTFGSLIQVPEELAAKLPALRLLSEAISHDLFVSDSLRRLGPLVQQAEMLAAQYDAVVANPPFIGSKWMNSQLKAFAKENFPNTEMDTFAMFFVRILEFTLPNRNCGVVSPFVWMFLSTYESARSSLLARSTITSLVQLEYNAFEPACVPVCAFTIKNCRIRDYLGDFIKLSEFRGHETQAPRTLAAIRDSKCSYRFKACTSDFETLPANPIAFWLSERVRSVFKDADTLGAVAKPSKGFDVPIDYFRFWYEVDEGSVFRIDKLLGKCRWVEVNKGGAFRRWYGNRENIVTFKNEGESLYSIPKANIRNKSSYFNPGITYSVISSSSISFRESYAEAIFYAHGSTSVVLDSELRMALLALCNSCVSAHILGVICPTLTYQVGDVAKLPVKLSSETKPKAAAIARECVIISKTDIDEGELSWEFSRHPLVSSFRISSCADSYYAWEKECHWRVDRLSKLQEECNQLFIKEYQLDGDMSSQVNDVEINLYRPDCGKDCQRLISYAIGCMMGRYSLDEPGLIYAHAGNVGFDATSYQTFPADADGIVPLTDELWFEDDAANRIREFLLAVWGADTLDENMAWLAESLGKKGNETPIETIRRYLSGSFYKDHLQTYKKRPIYWLFSSGKQGAFQALVYLHRYHEGTLARMRSEYVVPLTGKIQSRIEMLAKDKDAATSTAARNKLNKEIESLRKKHVELLSYDEKLRHYADMRIKLDLDDGVKVNYGKFGDLLSEVKAVTGGVSDD